MRIRAYASLSLTAVVIAAGLLTRALTPQVDVLPGRFEEPTVALELPRHGRDVSTVLDQPRLDGTDTVRNGFRRATAADFALAAAYAALWGVLAAPGWYVALPLAAGAADVVENVAIRRALRGGPVTDADARAIRLAALAKWTLLAATFARLFMHFRPGGGVKDGWQLWCLAIGVLYLYAALVCALGVAFDRVLIERAGLPLALALPMQIVLFAHDLWRMGRRDLST